MLVLALALAAQGCARKQAAAPLDPEDAPSAQIADPAEPWNRFWFGFNDVFFTYLGQPFSKGYKAVLPQYARDRIENIYSNALFPVRFLNAVFQLRPDKASRELGRFIVNSSFGLGGFLDLAASDKKLQPQSLDFGQTLGVWGADHGFYLVLPILGPSSLRDGFGMAVDATLQPTTYVDVPYLLTAGLYGAGRVNRLPEMIDLYMEIKRSAVEPYTAVRDAYAQLRERQVRQALAGAWYAPQAGEQAPAAPAAP
ncbi:putative phospholipid-binding lipoprotein MlaA [Fundidesulfovibrio magnetotacticus]|uniref:Putative phospholipid-binding lipoprotein MlaA n=2 Tax=Fundidesulfovibrio magnetotacticus TaxID=2730080 RepID=A0A6V8LXU2_9BACT|nr:putative phospholipid-binding lipoprotein MlaA [Fundidesulfovibrio magnetotacticus]